MRHDQIVEPVVAVHQPQRAGRRNVLGQPFDQPLHGVDRFGLGRAVLLRPAVDLARDIVLAAAEVAKTDRAGSKLCSCAMVAFMAS